MPKSSYLGLELTDDSSTKFQTWRESINSSAQTSNAQIIDKFASESDNSRMIEIDTDGAVTQSQLPNVFYNYTGNLTSLSITLATAIANRACEYNGQFVTGETVPTLVFPSNIVWINNFPDIEANKTYQFSIMNNIGVIVSA